MPGATYNISCRSEGSLWGGYACFRAGGVPLFEYDDYVAQGVDWYDTTFTGQAAAYDSTGYLSIYLEVMDTSGNGGGYAYLDDVEVYAASIGVTAGIVRSQAGHGDTVCHLTDQSGNGNHYVQPVILKRGMLDTSGAFPVVVLDGIDDFFDAGLAQTTNGTLVIVGKPHATSYLGAFAGSYAAGGRDGGTDLAFLGINASSLGGNLVGGVGTDSVGVVTAPGSIDGQLDVYALVYDETTWTLRKSGAVAATGPRNGSISGVFNVLLGAAGGTAGAASAFASLELAEFLDFDYALSDSQIGDLEAALQGEYGL